MVPKIQPSVGEIIWQQLGGRRFALMTGAKNALTHENGLSFQLGRNKTKTNRVLITLTPADTYTMEFQYVTTSRVNSKGDFVEGTVKTLKKSEDVYCDMLTEIFENFTGLYVSIGR